MLTGDAKQVAEPIAKRLGIDEVQAELLPGEKATDCICFFLWYCSLP